MEESNNEQPDWLAIARSRLTAEKWQKIVDGAIERAADNDQKAIDFVSSWCLPQPKDRSDPSSRKVREVRLIAVKSKEEADGLTANS